MKTKKVLLSAAVSALTIAGSQMATAASTITEALTEGKGYVDARLRYENVDQDGIDKTASGLTVRTFVGYKTAELNGFSAHVEMEDTRVVLGIEDFNSTQNGKTEYPVIADPEHTELDQGYIAYKSSGFSAKLGRQVYVLDNQRFVGHVGWRQDRQTFDALSVDFTPTDKLSFKAAYLDQRNRILGEAADINSEDLLLNFTYKTPIGALKAYSYMLAVEDTDAADNDTFGFSFAPKFGPVSLYGEFATQETGTDAEADYLHLSASGKAGAVTLKAGYELLGSDDGEYGFSTPLATLHKFNGWADKFLGTPAVGLQDLYFTASAKVGPGKLAATFHKFDSDFESTDLGSELDLVYAMKFGKNYNAGVKGAFYTQGDDNTPTDTNKIWVWFGTKF